ncbi:MAG: CHASE domain-containing protein [Novosphingobium sp.]
MPITLLAIGLLITTLFVLNIERTDAMARKMTLDTDVTSLATELERKASENAAYLKAAAALFGMTKDVSHDEFSRFVAEMSADHSTRGALGMGWTAWVPAGTAPAFEAEQRRLNPAFPFRVFPATDPMGEKAVIALLAPKTPENTRALGFDMYSEVVRRTAMQQAVKLDRPVGSGRVQLIQDVGKPPVSGVLIFLPVYGRQEGGASAGPLKGFIYTPVRVPELLGTAIIGTHRTTGRVAIYDGEPDPARLLAATPGAFNEDEFSRAKVDFAGRPWTIVVSANRGAGLTVTSMLVLGLGTLISLLVMAVAWLVTSRAAEDRKVLEWLSDQAALRTSLTRELNHRVKNTLANVLSIVALTRRRTRDIDEFAEGLSGRLRALSATHDLLSQREWTNALVADVVQSELAPYLDPEDPHAEISGPDALLAPNDAMSLGLALHELATNAAKYGALSVPEGKVSVTWEIISSERVSVSWQERGGPPVSAPTRRGFGLELIEKIVSHELDAPVDLRFASEGVACTLVVPMRSPRQFTIRTGPVAAPA